MSFVNVRNNNGEAAIRKIKKMLQNENVFTEMKRRRYYESPSEGKVRKSKESARRVKKMRRMRSYEM